MKKDKYDQMGKLARGYLGHTLANGDKISSFLLSLISTCSTNPTLAAAAINPLCSFYSSLTKVAAAGTPLEAVFAKPTPTHRMFLTKGQAILTIVANTVENSYSASHRAIDPSAQAYIDAIRECSEAYYDLHMETNKQMGRRQR